ncbi:MAG TPA: MlaE family lipid ABC transporter permease subunit [Acidobacteriota bacterium]|nr:MlaE family lipid ABC transporter permease subunit [Acidobacteriota bacterium]
MNEQQPQQTPLANQAARISFTADQNLYCSGAWTLDHLAELELRIADLLEKFPGAGHGQLKCEVSAVTALDTGGAWLLQRTVNQFEHNGCTVALDGLSPDFSTLMDAVAQSWSRTEQLQRAPAAGWTTRLGRLISSHAANVGNGLTFLGETTTVSLTLFSHVNRMRWRMLLYNLQVDGLNALPIIGLLSFLMGIVIAYQGAEQLKQFGANIFIVDLLGISLLREIAPLLTAILVAGRSGSAYAAQIGTMRVTEELDALSSLGISPISLLVIPRALALVIALPLLSVFADAVGVFGGMLIALSQLGVTFTEFLNRFEYAIVLRHYLIGMSKTPVFAMIIALVGCYQGFQVAGGVHSVGRHTTISVVQAIFLVIVTDAFFSILFSWWEI